MSPTVLLTLAVVAAAGAAVAMQSPINAALGRHLGSTLAAASFSFLVGTLALGAVTVALQGPAHFARLALAPAGLMVGGLFGAFFVWATLWAIPSLGALTTFATLILGQLTMALILDAQGAFGLPVAEVSAARVAALGLVAGGIVLSRL